MGPHLAGRTHGVDMTMKRSAWRAVPTRAASRSRADPGLAVPSTRSPRPRPWGRAGWAELPNPVVALATVPGPSPTRWHAVADEAVTAGCHSTGGGPVATRAGRTRGVRLEINSRSKVVGGTCAAQFSPSRERRGPDTTSARPTRARVPLEVVPGSDGSDHRLGAWAATSGRPRAQLMITGRVAPGPGSATPA
jgi:hypothetical protein